ncbi:MAG: alpha-1,4-glucan--maltose-1-phosphate maltosyltransferase [Acetobacteraceae bacterium]|nr:alpha-1,4-glucan--maltose-1-phosphate maltosyltransferase [Acetobacteraceae bacterium]
MAGIIHAGPIERDTARAERIAIEAVAPAVPDGDFAVKRVIGDTVTVSADIIADGHEILAAALLWRAADETTWQRVPMQPTINDRWEASFAPARIGPHYYTVEAWWDVWATFRHDLHAKHAAGQVVSLEIEEGRQMIQAALARSDSEQREALQRVLDALAAAEGDDSKVEILLATSTADAVEAVDDRPFVTQYTPHLRLDADRPQAAFASWYELFPRSATKDPSLHGTFNGVIGRLPQIRAMGFDVLYFPPIHPIGTINRKGRNNSLRAQPGDLGSPYAIGSAEGGHDAIHPQLGTLEDFRKLVTAARRNGLEIALDFAIQCSPDHPWLKKHHDWFRWRPDGSMRYAENPPKKYEDIVNPDFYAEAALPDVWLALRDVVQFWVDQDVRIFRVDNPHTKPLPFWRWMITDIRDRHPDVIFLSEAFTKPKMMYRLAKVGFTQSYTYFTWRNTKHEIADYLTELNSTPVRDFFRPNFFVNTPDINPVFLQTSGRAGFLIRAALATTLSGLWGMYSGFEICEATPLPGREEYLDSEKYEIRVRDYAAPGNIVSEITALNRLRRSHPALQTHLGLTFYNALNDQVLLYGKRAPGSQEIILVAVSFDPHAAQEAVIEVPLWEFGLPDHGSVHATDLMRGSSFVWHGKNQRIRLDPADLPFAVWQLTPPGVV